MLGRLRRWRGRVASSPPAPAYRPEELARRFDEFNAAAERHWAAIAADPSARRHVLNKPLSTGRDTGAILYRLGLVLHELRLGPGHTVLEFAAGSCWLSALLNRMGCRTIAVDVSPSALALGQELFGLDPRQRPELEPRFLAYDGRRLPLADAAVDRVVCFDGLHHVPNVAEVLGELARVLKPGGRAVFAEPGEGHRHGDEGRLETEEFGVLENDLPLPTLLPMARDAGFTGAVVKPYPEPDTLELDPAAYARFMDGDDVVFGVERVRQSLRQFSVFVLTKGEATPDSRAPGVLRAEIRASLEPAAPHAGEVVHLVADVRNTGDTRWLRAAEHGGRVELGVHVHDEDGRLLRRDAWRGELPHDVPPGGEARVSLQVAAPERRGRQQLRLDMVAEGVAWFERAGSTAALVPLVVSAYRDSAAPHRLGARLEPLAPLPAQAAAGELVVVPLRLTNTGDTVWRAEDGPGRVGLGARVRRDAVELTRDSFRVPLPRAVAPDESIELPAAVPAPAAAGDYVLELDLVAEGVCWFEHHGSPPLVWALRVEAGA